MSSELPTKFEEDLKAFFPDLWELHMLAKTDEQFWELVKALRVMRAEDVTGMIVINYSRGHIDGIKRQEDMLAHKAKRPGY